MTHLVTETRLLGPSVPCVQVCNIFGSQSIYVAFYKPKRTDPKKGGVWDLRYRPIGKAPAAWKRNAVNYAYAWLEQRLTWGTYTELVKFAGGER